MRQQRKPLLYSKMSNALDLLALSRIIAWKLRFLQLKMTVTEVYFNLLISTTKYNMIHLLKKKFSAKLYLGGISFHSEPVCFDIVSFCLFYSFILFVK